jgi:cysteinyl-tRNA synthetase
MEHHYSVQLDFTWEKLAQSQARLFNLRKECAKIASQENLDDINNSIIEKVLKSCLDNLKIAESINPFQDYIKVDGSYSSLKKLDSELYKLNLFPTIPENVITLGNARQTAKENKDFATADKLRGEIASLGWQVDDYPWGFGLWSNPTLRA